VGTHADCRELHDLVDALPEGQVALLPADLKGRLSAEVTDHRWPPTFFGMGVDRDGRRDLSDRVDEVFAEGFGAPRS
jgi:hypothetical protein